MLMDNGIFLIITIFLDNVICYLKFYFTRRIANSKNKLSYNHEIYSSTSILSKTTYSDYRSMVGFCRDMHASYVASKHIWKK